MGRCSFYNMNYTSAILEASEFWSIILFDKGILNHMFKYIISYKSVISSYLSFHIIYFKMFTINQVSRVNEFKNTYMYN